MDAVMQYIPDWLQPILLLGAYIALMKWVFPRFGVGS